LFYFEIKNLKLEASKQFIIDRTYSKH